MFQNCKQTRHPITAAVISHPSPTTVMTHPPHTDCRTLLWLSRLAVAAALFSKTRRLLLEEFLEISHQLHKTHLEPAAEHLQLFYEEVKVVLSVPTCVRGWTQISSSSSSFLGESMKRIRSSLVGGEFIFSVLSIIYRKCFCCRFVLWPV